MRIKRLIVGVILLCLGHIAFAQVHFNIQGTAYEKLENSKVYLILTEKDNLITDSTTIKSGKFVFEGELPQPCWASIRIVGMDGIFIVLENGITQIFINEETVQCTGTPTNSLFQEYWIEYGTINQKMRNAFAQIDSLNISAEEKKDLLVEAQQTSISELKSFVRRAIIKNQDNIIPAFWIRIFQELLSPDELNKMLANASPVLKNNVFMRNILNTQPGCKIVDAVLETPLGVQVNFSDYCGNGNFTLVNIWASWCSPCIAEFSIIRAIKEKYSSKGLEVVSISQDREKKDWKEALLRLDLPWSHLWGDYSFFNLYGINRIPALILISPDGIILKKYFKAEELNDIMKDFLID